MRTSHINAEINKIFRRIMHWTGKNGGGTFGLYGAPIMIKSGYQVGGSAVAPTLKLYFPKHESTAIEVVVQDRFRSWYKTWARDDTAGFMLGTWKADDGTVYIDLTEHVASLVEAFAMARARCETHIWD